MQYAPGSRPVFYASFTDENLQPTDPDEIIVRIYDPDGVLQYEGSEAVKDSTGNYHFDAYEIPEETSLGLWKIEWEAITNGQVSFGEENFDVTVGGVIVNPAGLVYHGPLRSRLGEVSRLDVDQNGSDTLFSNAEISEILTMQSYDLDRATLEGWQRKAAKLQHLIDISESGSERALSRKFIQARQMLDHWARRLSDASEARSAALTGRVVGKVLSLREEEPLRAYPWGPTTDVIRAYPTHRLLIPATLG